MSNRRFQFQPTAEHFGIVENGTILFWAGVLFMVAVTPAGLILLPSHSLRMGNAPVTCRPMLPSLSA